VVDSNPRNPNGWVRPCIEIATIFATFGAPDFRVKLQVNGCDFSAIVVSHLGRDVSAPSPD
jgi:hypothetical protein